MIKPLSILINFKLPDTSVKSISLLDTNVDPQGLLKSAIFLKFNSAASDETDNKNIKNIILFHAMVSFYLLFFSM